MAMDENDPFVRRVMEWIQRGNDDLDEEKEKADDIIGAYDALRTILYHEWDPEKFRVDNRDTWPLIFKDQEKTIMAFDQLHEGVGYSHQFVIKYRYSDMNPRVQPLQPLQTAAPVLQPPQPLIVTPASPLREDASRVRSIFTGPYEVKLERLRLEAELEIKRLEMQKRSPLEGAGAVSKDPLEPGNELMAYLTGLREYLMICFDGWGRHRNRYYAERANRKLRRMGVKLISTIESFVYATSGLNILEMNDKLTAQTSLFTEILRTQAGVPVTVQEFHNYRPDGVDLNDGFEEKEPGQRRLLTETPPPAPQQQD